MRLSGSFALPEIDRSSTISQRPLIKTEDAGNQTSSLLAARSFLFAARRLGSTTSFIGCGFRKLERRSVAGVNLQTDGV